MTRPAGANSPRPRADRRVVSDALRWAQSLPANAPASICLPSFGRVLVRTYDTTTCTFDPVPGSDRWVIETAAVPVAPSSTRGLTGPVLPGDCLIYIGTSEADDEDVVWFPQRVLDVVVTARTQIVVTLGDLTVRDEGVDPSAFAPVLHAPLTGTIRRWALESFGLNVDCEQCGARGRPIVYGLPSSRPSPHVVLGGCLVEAGDPRYACDACGAAWRVGNDGSLEFAHRDPTLWEQT